MRRIVIAATVIAVAVVLTWTLLHRAHKKTERNQAARSSQPSEPIPTASVTPATVLYRPDDVKSVGLQPLHSAPMSRSQWSAFLKDGEHEARFQVFRQSAEYQAALEELQAVEGRSGTSLGLALDDVPRIRTYLHHEYHGFRAAAVQVVEKSANTAEVKEALLPDVVQLLDDVSPTVRRAAVRAVMALKPSAGATILAARSQSDPEPAVREEAERAMNATPPPSQTPLR